MIRLPFFQRGIGLAAALGLLCAQAVLPTAHSWRVGMEEAAYHAGAEGVVDPGAVSPERASTHSHHNEADCPLCPLSSSARVGVPQGAIAVQDSGPGSSLFAVAAAPVTPTDVPGAPPRGPPAVLA